MPKKREVKTVNLHRQSTGKGFGDGTPFKDLHAKLRWCLLGRNSAWLEELKQAYQDSDNPLFVWNAYKFARINFVEIPAWVLDYFDNAADNLLGSGNKNNSDIPAILEFRGRGQGSAFNRWMNYHVRAWAVAMASEMLGREPHRNDVFSVVAEKMEKVIGRTYSERTVKNWYDEEKPD